MSIAELMFQMNCRSLEELIPLSDVATSGMYEVNEMREFPWSIEDFQLHYPEIPIENIYVLKNAISPYIYVDLSCYCLLDLQIIGGKSVLDVLNPERPVLIPGWKKQVEQFASLYESRRFDEILMRLHPAFVLSVLNRILETELPSEGLYDLFLTHYRAQDYGASFISRKAWETIDKSFQLKESKRTFLQDALSHLPDLILVYRGEGDKSTPAKQSPSWTLSPNVALFFALRFATNGQDEARLVKGVVSKKDVLAYLTQRGEEELVVRPGSVKINEVVEFLSLDDLQHDVVSANHWFLPFREQVQRVPFKSHGRLKAHDKLHTLRVGRLASIIAGFEDLTEEEHELLMTAVLYHDSARLHDGVDDEHGARATSLYLETHGEISPILNWLLTNHCLSDDVAKLTLPAEAQESIDVELILQILKDADALDRLRFGYYDLDITQLRRPISIDLIWYAELCVNFLRLD